MHRRWVVVPALALLGLSCATGRDSELKQPQDLSRKPGVTDYADEGKLWYVGVSVRAARLSGPGEMLPLNVVLVDKDAGEAEITRESFTLETPDRTLLPVVGYGEFQRGYRRDRADQLAGEEYVERHAQVFSQPPFTWRRLDFFPLRNSRTTSRDSIETRRGELLHGYLYFAAPALGETFSEGKYKLLFRPSSAEAPIVVEFYPF